MPEPITLLADARDYARRAARFAEGFEYASFAADEMRKAAVCFCIVIIAEACNQIGLQHVVLPDDIPWARIKGMRNILVHSYWLTDDSIVYKVARDDVPVLADRLDRLIQEWS